MTKTIAVGLKKGGVGKSTLATNQAALLAMSGKKTLLVDLDPQGHVLLHFGVDPKKFNSRTITDLVTAKVKSYKTCLLDKKYLADHIQPELIQNLDILPANYLLKGYLTDTRHKDPEDVLYNAILKIAKTNDYDYIVFDTNPDWTTFMSYLFLMVDAWVIPFNLTIGAKDGLDDLVDAYKSVKIDQNKKLKLFIVPNGLNITKRKDKETGERKIVETAAVQCFNTVVKQNAKIKDLFITEVLSKTDQYENAVQFLGCPVSLIKDKKLKQFNKAKKQQKQLHEFIVSKLG